MPAFGEILFLGTVPSGWAPPTASSRRWQGSA